MTDFFSHKACLFTLLVILSLSACSKQTSLISNGNARIANPVVNVKIHDGGRFVGPCEPSIFISPLNPDMVVAGSVLDNLYLSMDGGASWKSSKLQSSFGVYGDPVVVIDQKGKIYYAHLSNPKGKAYGSEEFLDRIVVQTSDDGINFSDGSFPPSNHSKDHDKHWLAVDPADNTILMTWTEFDKYGSKEEKHKSRILFSKSTDQGVSWSKAISLSEWEGDCIDDDATTEGAVPCAGVDGEYYVVWSFNEKIILDVSYDRGNTWMIKDKVIATQPGGWAFDIPGISRCNGMPVINTDHSFGPKRGTLYVSWSDQRNGENNTDVWLISSSDKGKTWSAPVRVNNDAGEHQQFFSWFDVDPVTGFIYWVFYDRRNHADNQTDVYLAWSKNGGKSIENIKISDTPFVPSPNVFFGDYNNISAYNGKIRPIWTRLENGQLSVYTALIDIINK